MLLTVAVLMAAMMAASALPAGAFISPDEGGEDLAIVVTDPGAVGDEDNDDDGGDDEGDEDDDDDDDEGTVTLPGSELIMELEEQ